MLKWWILFLVLAFGLTGCGAQEVFETIADEQVLAVMAQPREVDLSLPPEAAVPVLNTDSCQVYAGEDYEILVETLSAGDLDATLRAITGYPRSELTLMQTQWEDVTRYEFVWAAAGEEGDRLGRGVVLDDGEYHYCLSLLRDAAAGTEIQEWNDLFDSFSLRNG